MDDGNLVWDVDGDGSEVEEVEDDEVLVVGDIGGALVVVATASDFDLECHGFGANHSGLHMGFLAGGYDDGGLGGGGSVESGVSYVILEH